MCSLKTLDLPFCAADTGGEKERFAGVENAIPFLGLAYLAAVAEQAGNPPCFILPIQYLKTILPLIEYSYKHRKQKGGNPLTQPVKKGPRFQNRQSRATPTAELGQRIFTLCLVPSRRASRIHLPINMLTTRKQGV